MTILKRATLFLQRNLVKSIVLGLSTLTMGIIIFTITTGSMGINKLINEQLELYSPSVSVELDYDTLYNSSNNIKQSEANKTLTKEQINQIEQSDYWLSTFNSTYFDFLINPNNGVEQFMPTVIPYSGETTKMQGNEELLARVQGVDTPNYITDEANFTFNYQFSDQELSSNANVVMLNDEYMKFNGLKVGDTINFGYTMDPIYDVLKIDLEDPEITWLDYEIVGSYTYTPSSDEIANAKENVKHQDNQNPNSSLYYYYNLIYMPVTTVASIKDGLAQEYLKVNDITEEEMLFNEQRYMDYTALDSDVKTTFKFDDVKNKDAFIKEIKAVIEGIPNVVVEDLSDAYLWQYGLLGSIAEYSSIILIATIIVSSIFLSFIIVLFIRDRQKEIGILIALGEKKKNIYIQVVLELGLLMTGSFIIAMPIGYYIVVSQVENIPFTINAIILLFVVGFVITIFATLIPLLYMLNLSPKKILM